MQKVILFSLLLIGGMLGSQAMPESGRSIVQIATMFCLSFIMIHVGYEFEIDKSRPLSYAWDYVVAAIAASLPWLLCALYFVFVMSDSSQWGSLKIWEEAALKGLFAAPTSAGVLFSMLAAAGLGASWVFGKARILAIFDDLNTLLLLIPLQALIIGPKWQLLVIAGIMVGLIWISWQCLNTASWPTSWPWILSYAAAIVAMSEIVYLVSKKIDPVVPIHLEVLLPAFALGCVLKPAPDCHAHDAVEGHEIGPDAANEQKVSTIISGVFMLLVGLSMPPIVLPAGTGWGTIALHVLLITILSNIGKLFPAFCYRKEASFRERLALAVGMFPRGEVGAGVLVISLSYGMGGASLTVAILSLSLNLICTGLFILAVKKLIAEKNTVPAIADSHP